MLVMVRYSPSHIVIVVIPSSHRRTVLVSERSERPKSGGGGGLCWCGRRDSDPGRWLGRPLDALRQCPRPG